MYGQMKKLCFVLLFVAAAASGEILFSDDFNDGNDDGWTRSGSASWDVVSGEYLMYSAGEKGQGTSYNGDENGAMSTPDYSILATINIDAGTNAGMIARFNGPGTWYYKMTLKPAGDIIRLERKQDGGPALLLEEYSIPIELDTEYFVRLQVTGDQICGRIWTGTPDDEPDQWQVSAQDDLQGDAGSFALTSGGYGRVRWSCEFDDVVVSTPLPMELSPATWAALKQLYID